VRALVVGGGSWGTAFAGVLADAGHTVELACRDAAAVAELSERRENHRYLPGIRIADGVQPVLLDLPRQSPEAELIALALPAAAYAEAAEALRLRPDAYVVHQGEGTLEIAFVIADALRGAGHSVVMHAGGGGFKSQMKKADASGAWLALIVGEDEVRAGEISVKALRRAGDQQRIGRARVAEEFAAILQRVRA